MEIKIIKKRKSKNATDFDRAKGRKLTRNKSYHKNKPKKENIIKLYGDFNDTYRLGIFKFIIPKDYDLMITLTHDGKVTLKQHDSIVNKKLKDMVAKGYLDFYFKVNEWDYVNYHSHILVKPTNKVKDIYGVFRDYWKEYGFSDVVRFKNIIDKYYATDYCLKQLKPLDRRHMIQELIDTWCYFEAPAEVIEIDLFRNEEFLVSVRSNWDYVYKRPVGSLIIPEMDLNEAFNRLQAKLDNRKQVLSKL